MIVGAGKSKIYRAGWKHMQKMMLVWRQNFFISEELKFLLLRPSINWLKPIHISKGIYFI